MQTYDGLLELAFLSERFFDFLDDCLVVDIDGVFVVEDDANTDAKGDFDNAREAALGDIEAIIDIRDCTS